MNKTGLFVGSPGEDHAVCFGGMSRHKGDKKRDHQETNT